MKSLADALPPEIARQIHPDWRKNEAAYWAVRDQLLGQYQGQWIGFADGAVIASGTSPVAVFHAAEATGRNPFVTCVGREDEPARMRRASFAYDGSYPGEPLPILTLEFRPVSGSPGVTLDRVIADTGADAGACSAQGGPSFILHPSSFILSSFLLSLSSGQVAVGPLEVRAAALEDLQQGGIELSRRTLVDHHLHGGRCATGPACRPGERRASYTSPMATMRAARGMSLPASRSG